MGMKAQSFLGWQKNAMLRGRVVKFAKPTYKPSKCVVENESPDMPPPTTEELQVVAAWLPAQPCELAYPKLHRPQELFNGHVPERERP